MAGWNIIEGRVSVVDDGTESDGDGCELRPGNRRIRLKGPIVVPQNDTRIGQCRNSVVAPEVLADIAIRISLAPEFASTLIRQQPEKDSCYFCTGNQVVWTNSPIRVTNDIRHMVFCQCRRIWILRLRRLFWSCRF